MNEPQTKVWGIYEGKERIYSPHFSVGSPTHIIVVN